jgi:hypothetical protein
MKGEAQHSFNFSSTTKQNFISELNLKLTSAKLIIFIFWINTKLVVKT